MKYTFNTTFGKVGIGGAILLIITVLIIEPWIVFWFSYLGGIFAKFLIGNYLVAGAATLGINLPIDKIPLIAGCLGWIGSFFKNSNLSAKE